MIDSWSMKATANRLSDPAPKVRSGKTGLQKNVTCTQHRLLQPFSANYQIVPRPGATRVLPQKTPKKWALRMKPPLMIRSREGKPLRWRDPDYTSLAHCQSVEHCTNTIIISPSLITFIAKKRVRGTWSGGGRNPPPKNMSAITHYRGQLGDQLSTSEKWCVVTLRAPTMTTGGDLRDTLRELVWHRRALQVT